MDLKHTFAHFCHDRAGELFWKDRKNWVSATTRDCPRSYRWCNGQSALYPVNQTLWKVGQPQEGGVFECVQLTLNNGSVSYLSDEACSSNAYFACEVRRQKLL
jgi:hypothetical protein